MTNMKPDIYDVYCDVDDNYGIIKIFSTAFEKPNELKIAGHKQYKMDSGAGDRFKHAQNNYLSNGLFNENYQPKYKWIYYTDSVALFNEKELNELYPIIIEPTEEDKTDAKILYMEMLSNVELSTVVETSVLSNNSPWFDKLKFYYETKLWTAEMIQLAVTYKRITQAECDEILSLQVGGE